MMTTSELYAVHNALDAATVGLGGEVEHQALLARLELFEESVVLTRYREGQPSSTYEVDPDALAQTFSGLPLVTGLLPRECLFFERAAGRERIGVYVPPQMRALYVRTSDSAAPLNVPLPGLVWIGCGREYHVFATKQRPSAPSERLFRAPMPNVYLDGRVCLGDVEIPECRADTIHQALDLFFHSAFNRDLSAHKSAAYDECILEQWQALSSAAITEYPLDDLLKTDLKLVDVIEVRR